MSYSFPIPADEMEDAEQAIEAHKEKTGFDEFLAELLARRIVSREKIYDYEKVREIADSALGILKEHVNAEIRRILCSPDVLAGHHLHIKAESKKIIYIPEDKVRKRVRVIVSHIYHGSTPHDILRKKEVGCITAICHVINGPAVSKIFHL